MICLELMLQGPYRDLYLGLNLCIMSVDCISDIVVCIQLSEIFVINFGIGGIG